MIEFIAGCVTGALCCALLGRRILAPNAPQPGQIITFGGVPMRLVHDGNDSWHTEQIGVQDEG